MAEVLDILIKQLRDIKDDIPRIMTEVIEDNSLLIEDMVIAQLQQGKRGDGETLPNYSYNSVHKYGKPPGPIKLFDQGYFYKAMTVRVTGNALEMDNTDSKVGKLTLRYGVEIVELSDAHIESVKFDILLPGMIEKVQNRLQ
jgi:hypothetical protein